MFRFIKNKISLGIIIGGLLSVQGLAQVAVEGELTYNKLADNTVSITGVISDSEEDKPVSDLQIEFLSRLDSTSKSLGTVTTNDEGVAVLDEVPFSSLLLSLDHRFNLTFKVAENDDYIETPKELSFSEVDMKLDFMEIDSIKQIVVTLSSWNEEGSLIPVEEAEAYLYVPRLFSLLPIGDIYTDEEGKGMMAFPVDLPGDKSGEMMIVAKIEDHEKFGNVEVSNTINWAKPGNHELEVLPRALWSTNTPVWMLITFIVLMVGVWFHYGWILFNLFRIRSYSRMNSNTKEIIYDD